MPIAFSRGFNPKPKIIFGPPLQLGVASECEFVDIFLVQKVAPEALLESLSAKVPPGLTVFSAAEVPLKTKPLQELVKTQRYSARAVIHASDDAPVGIADWQQRSIKRVSGKAEKVIPLATTVRDMTWSGGTLSFEIPANTRTVSAKPFEVVQAVTELDPLLFDVVKTGCELAQ